MFAGISRLERAHNFAKLLCTALGEYIPFVTLGEIDNGAFTAIGAWAGEKPEEAGNEPYVSGSKLLELFKYGNNEGLSSTPIDGAKYSLGWQGGIRWDNLIVATSGWPGEHDKLLSAIVLYSLLYETRLHHVGFCYPTLKEMDTASQSISTSGIHVPATDHERVYHRMETELNYNGVFYKETQFFPGGPHDNAKQA